MSDYPNYETPEEIAYNYPRDAGPANPPKPQEQIVETTQELPAVSKLREAFEVARNAIVDGSELAKLVDELRRSVNSLNSEVSLLQRDLEYIRNRNKELDEQVTEVRRQRDIAIAEATQHKQHIDELEAINSRMSGIVESHTNRIETLENLLNSAKRERDDAMVMALEYEGKLKEAQAKLATIEALFVGQTIGASQEKPKPHYLDQPRDEVGKFQPIEGKTYDQGSQGSF